MSNLEHFNLGPVSDVDPDVLTDQILDALGLYIEDDAQPEKTNKALDSLTDLMQKVAEGKLTASAAISITKSAGLHDSDVEDAIIAQSVIGRRAIAKALATEEEEEEEIVMNVGISARQRLINQLDLNGDGYVTVADLVLAGEQGITESWLELFAQYGLVFDDVPEEEKEEEEKEEEENDNDQFDDLLDQIDRGNQGIPGDGIIQQGEWDRWVNRYNNGQAIADLNGDGVIDQADFDIALILLERFGEQGIEKQEEVDLQDTVELLAEVLLDADEAPTTEAQVEARRNAENVMGAVSVSVGTERGIPARVRGAMGKKRPSKKPGSGPTGLTADTGGGGVVGGSGDTPGGGG